MVVAGNWIDSTRQPTLYPGTAVRWDDAPAFDSVAETLNAFVRYKEGLSSIQAIPDPNSGKNDVDAHWLGYFDLDAQDTTVYSRGTTPVLQLFPESGSDVTVPRSVYGGGGDLRYALAARVRLAVSDDPDLDIGSGANAWYVLVFRVPVSNTGFVAEDFAGLSGAIFDNKHDFLSYNRIMDATSLVSGDVDSHGAEYFLYLFDREAVVNGVQTRVPDLVLSQIQVVNSSATLWRVNEANVDWKLEVIIPLAHELVEPVGTLFVPAPQYKILGVPPPLEVYEGDLRPGDWGWDLAR